MADVRLFGYDWVTPALAYLSAVLGCALGAVLLAKARACRGRDRVRLLGYAVVAVAGVGTWQTSMLGMSGLRMAVAAVRFDLSRLGAALAVAVALVGAGVFLAGYGLPRPARLVPAAGLVGGGIALSHQVAMGSIRVGGTVGHDPLQVVTAALLTTLAATATLWATRTLARLRTALLAAVSMAAAVTGLHYANLWTIRIHLAAGAGQAAGVAPMTLFIAVVLLGGAATAMLAYLSLGASTLRDLRLLYESPQDPEQIEPWLIAEVSRRVAGAGSDNR